MNLIDSSFLCLDIGTSCVRGIAHRVRGGALYKSATFSIDSYDTVFAIKSVVDELEYQIGRHFDTAYVTGDFGATVFDIERPVNQWDSEHKITTDDLIAQLSQITPPDGYVPMHMIPLQYGTARQRNITNPIGAIDRKLSSAFGVIYCPRARLGDIYSFLRRSHIQPTSIFDPHFVQSASLRQKKETVLFIDLGAEFATASIWADRGPMWYIRTAGCGTEITKNIATTLDIDFEEAERIKRHVMSMITRETNRFTPADAAYAFSVADVNDIAVPMISQIIMNLRDRAAYYIENYKPTRIVLTGGGAEIEGMSDYISGIFAIPCTQEDADATIRALSHYIWSREDAHIKAYIARRDRWARRAAWLASPFGIFTRHRRRRREKKRPPLPIMPSTLCFNMQSANTYTMFAAAGLSLIHVDIMDGLYVNHMTGDLDYLKMIREHTNSHLHVHLMTENPESWAAGAVRAGANTVIVSSHTAGVMAAVRGVRAAGCRAGIALNPRDKTSLLTDQILHELDEVMIMTVTPGAAGQAFQPECLGKISELAARRSRLGLKFLISVDGGIDATTAQMCWNAGADLLVSGSYLARSSDLPLAVQSLLNKSPR